MALNMLAASESSEGYSDVCREEIPNQAQGKYSADALMMMLDKEKLEALEEEFSEHPDGIELHNFVWLMKCAMPVPESEKAELVLGLYYLFQEIDINGDGHMEWSEFTQYIIDAVMDEKVEERERTTSEIFELAQSHKSRRYQLRKDRNRISHSGPVRTLKLAHSLDLLYSIEQAGDAVCFYTMRNELKYTISDQIVPPNFITAVAYNEREEILLVGTSDRLLHIYEKDLVRFRFTESFEVPFVCLKLWYCEAHQAWLAASGSHLPKPTMNKQVMSLAKLRTGLHELQPRKGLGDYKLKHIDIKHKCILKEYSGHSDMIMDAVELKMPFCVATASMDGTICLWDLHDQKKLGVLSGKHAKGVKQLDYCGDYGGNIVSVGYEKDIQVWNPAVSLNRCYTGRLEGHSSPVVACRFFRGRPTCVSVDDKGNVRLWDIRQLECLQIISQEKGRVEITEVIPIARHDSFVLVGKRLVWYEIIKEFATKNLAADVVPIAVEFNNYYLQIAVTTKQDMRVYDAITGKVLKLYTEVQDPSTESDLSAFSFDSRHRVFFVGDSLGHIRAYNYSNGALMSRIQGECTVQRPLENAEWNSEVSRLFYCAEDKILLAATWDSVISVYDVSDLNEPNLLRVMLGGHQGSDVVALTYSTVLSLIASASFNGITTVWDFETAKLEAVCSGHTAEVTALAFLEPYPVLATAGVDCKVCLWKVRPCVGPERYRCFLVIDNSSWDLTKEVPAKLTNLLSLYEESCGIQRHWRKRYVKRLKQELLTGKRGLTWKMTAKDSEEEEDAEFEWVEDPQVEVIEEPGLDLICKRQFIYIADVCGYLKIWSFESVLHKNALAPIARSERHKASYNPRRKDEKNVENDVKFWLQETEYEALPQSVSFEKEVLIREWKAHDCPVTSLTLISEPRGLLSYSIDKTFKLWSREGDQWGAVDLTSLEPPRHWSFPYNLHDRRRADIQKVREILALIGENLAEDDTALTLLGKQEYQVRAPRAKKAHQPRPVYPAPVRSPVLKDTPVSDDEDYEEAAEVPAKIERKYSGLVLDIVRELEAIDTKWAIGAKPVKFKNNEGEEPLRKTEKIPLMQNKSKLPRNYSYARFARKFNRQVSRKSSFNVDEMQLFDKALDRFNSSAQFMPRTGKFYHKLDPITETISKAKLGALKRKFETPGDIKHRPGEGQKLLSRAISSEAPARIVLQKAKVGTTLKSSFSVAKFYK